MARQAFVEEGWSKEDLRRYLVEHARVSVAALKRRFLWPAGPGEELSAVASAPLRPGDEERWVYLGREGVPGRSRDGAPGRPADFSIITSGAEIGHFHLTICSGFPEGSSPVTKAIRARR